MGYASVLDVHQLNTGRPTYTASSKPTASQVIDFLETTAAELDGILRRRGYTVPVPTTATSALKLLEGANAIGAAALVEQGAQSSDRRAEALALWESAKKMLAETDLDVAADTTTGTVRYPSTPSPFVSRDSDF